MLIGVMNEYGIEELVQLPTREKNTVYVMFPSLLVGFRKYIPQKKMSDAKDRYLRVYSDNRSVQENFNLIISFIQDSAEKISLKNH